MAYVWRYTGTCTKPTDLPEGVLDEWELTLKGEMDRILASLNRKIITPDKFEEYLADASSDVYEVFLNKVGDAWNKDIITLKQRLKLSASKSAWTTGVQNAFKVGGAFPTNVTNKKDKYKLARFVMGAVGHRATPDGFFGTWNPVTMAVLLMRGDKRPFRYFDGNDLILPDEAHHETAFDAVLGRLITPSIIAKSVEVVMFCKYAGDALWTEANIDSKIVTPANDKIKILVDACLISPYVGSVTLDWIHASKTVNVIAELTSKT